MRNYVIKGNICYSKSYNELCIVENGYVVCENRQCAGVYKELPERYEAFPCYDFDGKIVIPGFVDLHVHAPQHSKEGFASEQSLTGWLNTYALAEEEKYTDIEYAEKAYTVFVDNLTNSATTRACVFGTIHTEATLILMNKLEVSGLKTHVGKVDMDRNSLVSLCGKSTEKESADAEKWLLQTKGFENVQPILVPEKVPACLSYGIAPVKIYFKEGIKAGLGSDIAAGASLSIGKAMAMAVQCSQLNRKLYDQSARPLSFEEVFYMATRGGGEFFGKVGSFEEGYEFDAVVLEDDMSEEAQDAEFRKRLEKLIYTAEAKNIVAKFVSAKKIFEK